MPARALPTVSSTAWGRDRHQHRQVPRPRPVGLEAADLDEVGGAGGGRSARLKRTRSGGRCSDPCRGRCASQPRARGDWGLGTLALGGGCARKRGRVLVYGDDAYAPVIYLQDGRPQGFLVDVLRRVEARNTNGITFDLELMPWSRAYLLASRGKGG